MTTAQQDKQAAKERRRLGFRDRANEIFTLADVVVALCILVFVVCGALGFALVKSNSANKEATDRNRALIYRVDENARAVGRFIGCIASQNYDRAVVTRKDRQSLIEHCRDLAHFPEPIPLPDGSTASEEGAPSATTFRGALRPSDAGARGRDTTPAAPAAVAR